MLSKSNPPNWYITEATTGSDYILEVRFYDGLAGTVHMVELIFSNNAGPFSNLRDIDMFDQMRIVNGIITWPGNITIDSVTIHDEIKKNGSYILS